MGIAVSLYDGAQSRDHLLLKELGREIVLLGDGGDGHGPLELKLLVDLLGDEIEVRGIDELPEDEVDPGILFGEELRLVLDVGVVDVEGIGEVDEGGAAAGHVQLVPDLPLQLLRGEVLAPVVRVKYLTQTQKDWQFGGRIRGVFKSDAFESTDLDEPEFAEARDDLDAVPLR